MSLPKNTIDIIGIISQKSFQYVQAISDNHTSNKK